MSQMKPCQSSVPMQTSQNNFQTYRQAIDSNQQNTQFSGYPGNPQGQYTQSPFGQFYQQQQQQQQQGGCYTQPSYPCTTQLPANPSNFCQGSCQNAPPLPPQLSCNAGSPMQTQATNCGTLPQNIIDQIRACLANTAPIFILPGGCQQQPVLANQQATPMQVGASPLTGSGCQPSPVPNYVPPPSFYPYPIPFPMFETFGSRPKEQQKNCGCSPKSNLESMGLTRQCLPTPCFYNTFQEEEEHRCTETTDDTICSKRNCPSAISLQALASQLLSIQGIVSCAATRLILRKIPGSNITTSMEDTMERAVRSVGVLNKDQLLDESRNAQQVNTLINLHMTANPPTNIIPILTLIQLKVNVLKAQVENLINRRLMENQGLEVEATDSIDPQILALKTDAELREFLVILKQKECDERVNVNFAPYRSQRCIAENRLSNVQKKIRQVEGEFDRRRCSVAPSPPMSARIIREFAETPCCFSSFGYPGYMSPMTSERAEDKHESPDPFAITLRCPRKLRLKPHVGSPEATYDYSNKKQSRRASTCTEKGSQSEPIKDNKEKERADRSSLDNCKCYEEESSSSEGEESLEEDKKKLRLKVDQKGNVTVTSTARLKDVSLMKLAPNVSLRTRKASDFDEKRKRTVKPASYGIDEEDFPGLALSTVPMLEEISEVARIDDSASLDPVPNGKIFTRLPSEDESESFVKVPPTLEESKVGDTELEDETVEKKVDETDGDYSELDDWEFLGDDIDYEKMKQRVVTSSKLDFEESRSSEKIDKKTEDTIAESGFETSESIKVDPSRTEGETSGYYSRSTLENLTNDFEDTSTSIRSEASTRRLDDDDDISGSRKSTKTATAFFKINNGIKSESIEKEEERSGYYSRSQIESLTNDFEDTSTSIGDEGTTMKLEDKDDISPQKKKLMKTATAFLKINNNSIKSEPIKSEERTVKFETPDNKKRFITTATIRIGPPRSDDTKVEENNESTSGILENNSKETSSTIEEGEDVGRRTVTTLAIGGKQEGNQKSKFSTRNEKIVSMLTEIKYDNPESIAERFRSALTRSFQSNNDGDRCREEEEKRVNSGGNCTVALALPATPGFPGRIIDSEKHDNDAERSDVRRRDAFESTTRSSPQETELNASNFRPGTKGVSFLTSDGDKSSYFLETGVGLLSDAFSLMSNQIPSFGTVVNKIGMFANILSNFDKPNETNETPRELSENFDDHKDVWIDPCKEYLAVLEDVRKIEDRHSYLTVSNSSKRSIKKLDKDERSVIEGDWLRSLRGRLRHSIIKDKDNGKSYVVMLDDSFRELDSRSFPRTNLGRPYKIRRNLLIRSRLKECYARKQSLPPPFTILKRAREMNGKYREISCREEKKRYCVGKMKNEENFLALPRIRGKNSKISPKSSGLKMTHEYSTKTTTTVYSTKSYVSSSESLTLEVHDY